MAGAGLAAGAGGSAAVEGKAPSVAAVAGQGVRTSREQVAGEELADAEVVPVSAAAAVGFALAAPVPFASHPVGLVSYPVAEVGQEACGAVPVAQVQGGSWERGKWVGARVLQRRCYEERRLGMVSASRSLLLAPRCSERLVVLELVALLLVVLGSVALPSPVLGPVALLEPAVLLLAVPRPVVLAVAPCSESLSRPPGQGWLDRGTLNEVGYWPQVLAMGCADPRQLLQSHRSRGAALLEVWLPSHQSALPPVTLGRPPPVAHMGRCSLCRLR